MLVSAAGRSACQALLDEDTLLGSGELNSTAREVSFSVELPRNTSGGEPLFAVLHTRGADMAVAVSNGSGDAAGGGAGAVGVVASGGGVAAVVLPAADAGVAALCSPDVCVLTVTLSLRDGDDGPLQARLEGYRGLYFDVDSTARAYSVGRFRERHFGYSVRPADLPGIVGIVPRQDEAGELMDVDMFVSRADDALVPFRPSDGEPNRPGNLQELAILPSAGFYIVRAVGAAAAKVDQNEFQIISLPNWAPETLDATWSFSAAVIGIGAVLFCLFLLAFTIARQQRVIDREVQGASSGVPPASPNEIEMLPRRTLGAELLGDGGDTVCSICLAAFGAGSEVVTLPCGHHFDPACAEQWLLRKRTCPLCLQDITSASDVRSPAGDGAPAAGAAAV